MFVLLHRFPSVALPSASWTSHLHSSVAKQLMRQKRRASRSCMAHGLKTTRLPIGLVAWANAAARRLGSPRARAPLGLQDAPSRDEVIQLALELGLREIERRTRPAR